MNECCFVWGPPLSGQRYWMIRAGEETESDVSVTILPLESQNPQPTLNETLQSLAAVLGDAPPSAKRHIYCELPWEVVSDSTALEEWIGARPEFAQGTTGTWNLSFVGLCPVDADRLPPLYRRAMEEFGRASQSAIIIPRREGDDSDIDWFETEVLDFGKRIEVFEEDLWPIPSDNDRESNAHALQVEELQHLTLPVSGDRTSYSDLFADLAHGYYGPIWGAEAYWKNARGEYEALSLSQGRVFSWTCDNASLLRLAPVNGAMLSLVGGQLRRQDLILALRSQSFC